MSTAANGNAGQNGQGGAAASAATGASAAAGATGSTGNGAAASGEQGKAAAGATATIAAALSEAGNQNGQAVAAVDYDKLDFKKPADYKGADGDIAFVREMAKATGLTAEQAQKFFDQHAAVIARDEEAQAREMAQSRVDKIAQLKADTEFGGPKYAESITKADQFLAKYDPNGELLAELKQFGLEVHPTLVRLFMRAGRDMGEGKFVQPGTTGEGKQRAASAEEMYPSMTKR
jgi:hypothetical protein